MHDGLYVRLGLGAGALFGDQSDQEHTLHWSGVAVLSELAVGATLRETFVGGVGIYMGMAPSPYFEIDGESVRPLQAFVLTGVVGPFVDWYPNPKRGFHLQGGTGLGLAMFSVLRSEVSGTGIGLMAGAGYETWFAEQWSYGGAIRITYANAQSTDNGVDTSLTPAVIGAVATFTYH